MCWKDLPGRCVFVVALCAVSGSLLEAGAGFVNRLFSQVSPNDHVSRDQGDLLSSSTGFGPCFLLVNRPPPASGRRWHLHLHLFINNDISQLCVSSLPLPIFIKATLGVYQHQFAIMKHGAAFHSCVTIILMRLMVQLCLP